MSTNQNQLKTPKFSRGETVHLNSATEPLMTIKNIDSRVDRFDKINYFVDCVYYFNGEFREVEFHEDLLFYVHNEELEKQHSQKEYILEKLNIS